MPAREHFVSKGTCVDVQAAVETIASPMRLPPLPRPRIMARHPAQKWDLQPIATAISYIEQHLRPWSVLAEQLSLEHDAWIRRNPN